MHWSVVYGMMLAAVLILTWGSRNHVTHKLGLLMALSWAASNTAIALLGFRDAPIIVPSINAVVAILVGALGFSNRSWPCLAVFALFGVEMLISVWAYATHHNGEWIHYVALNVVFILRMLVVGGAAIHEMAHRLPGKYPRSSAPYSGR